VPSSPSGEEPFPNTQPEQPLMQLHAGPSGPFAGNQRKREKKSCKMIKKNNTGVKCPATTFGKTIKMTESTP